MAQSTCPNPQCKGHYFETVINTPRNSRFKLQFVQCASCGTVVGVMEYFNTGALLEQIAEALKIKLH